MSLTATRSIVIATDGSKCSRDAVRLGAKMARESDKVYLYHAYVRASFLSSAEPQERAALTMLSECVDELAKQGILNVEKIVEPTTDPRRAVCEFAESKMAQCVIMGTRGLGAMQRFMIGSTSEYVLHHVHDAVCIVHSWQGMADRLNYMVCVDGSAHSQRAVNRVASMVRRGDTVTLFHAFPAPPKVLDNVYLGDPDAVIVPSNIENPDYGSELVEAEGKADTLLRAIKHNFMAATDGNPEKDGVAVHVHRVATMDVRDAVVKAMKEMNIDVVAMGSRGDSDISKMIFGSVSNYVTHHVEGHAVLVVH